MSSNQDFDLNIPDPDHYYEIVVTPKQLAIKVPGAEPIFNNEIVAWLYQTAGAMSAEKVTSILALPRESLIHDLHAILIDCYARYDIMREKTEDNWLLLHCLLFARELKADELLEPILDLLSQSKEFLDYWLGDAITEMTWTVLFSFGPKHLPRFLEFLKEPGRYKWSRTSVNEAVTQMVHHGLIGREQGIAFFKEIIQLTLDSNPQSSNFVDYGFNADLVCVVIDLRATELLPLVEELFERGWVDLYVCGDYESVLEDLERPLLNAYAILPINTIYQDYENYANVMREFESDPEKFLSDEDDDFFEDDYEGNILDSSGFFESAKPYVREDEKIQRNDPCPCGSGKKYKKCHGLSA